MTTRAMAAAALVGSLAACRCEIGTRPDGGPGTTTYTPVSGNDRCDKAWPLPAGIGYFQGSTEGLSDDATGSCASGKAAPDAVFTANVTRRSRLSASTLTSGFDTVLYLRSASCTGTEVACNDDLVFFELSSAIAAFVDTGTYFLFLDGSSVKPSGEYRLATRILPHETASGNDTCAQAHPISGVGAVLTGDTTGMADDARAGCARAGGGPDAVFRLDLAARSRVEIRTAGASFDTVVSLRSGSCTGPEVGCNDDFGSGPDGGSPAGFGNSLLEGTYERGTYYLFLDGVGGDGGPFSGASGRYELEVAVRPE